MGTCFGAPGPVVRGAAAVGPEPQLRALPAGWSIPGAWANPGTSRSLLASPFLRLARDLAAKAVFHSCVNIWKKKGGKRVISVQPWECGCPENKQKLCFFTERPF